MDKDKFNRYCAEVMGYVVEEFSELHDCEEKRLKDETYLMHQRKQYNPYDDLNQMAGVVDVLSSQVEVRNLQGFAEEFATKMINNGIRSTMRDFIISTMQEKDNG